MRVFSATDVTAPMKTFDVKVLRKLLMPSGELRPCSVMKTSSVWPAPAVVTLIELVSRSGSGFGGVPVPLTLFTVNASKRAGKERIPVAGGHGGDGASVLLQADTDQVRVRGGECSAEAESRGCEK